MSFSARLLDLIGSIATFRGNDVFNPWCDTDPLDVEPTAPLARQKRLIAHFRCEPSLVLIGEAPGYRGCHFSGIPFTSEAQLVDDAVPRVLLPRENDQPGAKGARITTRRDPFAEASATIVWRALYDFGLEERVVMWNAFPWHPHRPGRTMTNRMPSPAERSSGLRILAELVVLYPDAHIVPVGRLAEHALGHLGVKSDRALRHPSMGGATIFRAGLRALAGGRKSA
jgi:uracil-DNA glycosylase